MEQLKQSFDTRSHRVQITWLDVVICVAVSVVPAFLLFALLPGLANEFDRAGMILRLAPIVFLLPGIDVSVQGVRYAWMRRSAGAPSVRFQLVRSVSLFALWAAVIACLWGQGVWYKRHLIADLQPWAQRTLEKLPDHYVESANGPMRPELAPAFFRSYGMRDARIIPGESWKADATGPYIEVHCGNSPGNLFAYLAGRKSLRLEDGYNTRKLADGVYIRDLSR